MQTQSLPKTNTCSAYFPRKLNRYTAVISFINSNELKKYFFQWPETCGNKGST